MNDKYAGRGLVIIGVSLDEDSKALRDMVARTGITWPQVCDGKGLNADLAKLFNAKAPTEYVLDRDGTIAAKHVGFYGWKNISGTIDRLMTNGR